ncbi:hypothetical protein AB0J68_00220 [Micromonospora sp. NPDC049580]|uniref:hypothetical protein n=1 Tax=Micromonospora sp. NPDC049580 TaxID=3154832 RepID=UPI00342833B8
MQMSELVGALSELRALRVEHDGSALLVTVPAIDVSLRLYPEAVVWLNHRTLPDGKPILQVVVRQHGRDLRMILLNDDVAWEPADLDSLLDSPIPVRLTDLPELVAYTELDRNSVGALRACDEPGANLAALAATLHLHRCVLVAAMRLGLRPLGAVRLWHELWCRVGEFAPAPYWPDPDFDRLLVEAGVPLTPYEEVRAGERPVEIEALTVADLRAAEPALTVGRADEAALAAWRQWMKLTPQQFYEVLTAELPDARVEISLYADGGAAVSLRIAPSDVLRVLLELRLSFPRRLAMLDEIRITEEATGTGLFQRIMSNLERLTRSLGLKAIKVYATGDGSVAFARAGFDWDRDPGD